MKNEKSTDGFTLIELLVVVVIVAVLSAIAAPGWLAFITNQRLNAVQDEMMQVFRSAQSDARRNNTFYSVAIDTTSGVALDVNPGESVVLGNEQIRDKLTMIAVDTNGDPVTSIAFDAKGQVAGALPIALTVDVSGFNSNSQCVIFTTLLGNMVAAEGNDCDSPSYAP